MVTVSKCLDAMNLMWILKMALALRFEGGIFVPLVNDDEPNDFDTYIFQYLVVQSALDCGVKNIPFFYSPFGFGNMEPNYDAIVENVKMFSSKLTTWCMNSFPDIVGRLVVLPHPLGGLQDWVRIHRIYHPEMIVADSDQVWQLTNTAMSTVIKPNTKYIEKWINNMEIGVKALEDSGVDSKIIDNVIVGKAIGKFTLFDGDITSDSA